MTHSFPTARDMAGQLVKMPSVGPEHGEAACAGLCADLLESAGFDVRLIDLAPGRPNVIAQLPGSEQGPMLCLSGHLDTVALGKAEWSFDPFCGEIEGGRLLGRGASDMKSGVAAMLSAALRLADGPKPTVGLALLLSAGEEHGLNGAKCLAAHSDTLPGIGAIIIGEPTSNRPMLGHKGGLWFHADFHGKAAHGSMPQLGDNAIVKAARGAVALSGFEFAEIHPVLGRPTINLGVIKGGYAPNIVPDHCRIECDVRVVPGMDPEEVLQRLGRAAPQAEIGNTNYLTPVWCDPDNPWMAGALGIVSGITGHKVEPAGAPYVTDASVLCKLLDAPALILGPGGPQQAHQRDEWCDAGLIDQAAEIYYRLAADWCGV